MIWTEDAATEEAPQEPEVETIAEAPHEEPEPNTEPEGEGADDPKPPSPLRAAE